MSECFVLFCNLLGLGLNIEQHIPMKFSKLDKKHFLFFYHCKKSALQSWFYYTEPNFRIKESKKKLNHSCIHIEGTSMSILPGFNQRSSILSLNEKLLMWVTGVDFPSFFFPLFSKSELYLVFFRALRWFLSIANNLDCVLEMSHWKKQFHLDLVK